MNDKRHSSYSSQATAASALLVHRVAQIFASRRFIRPGLAVLWGAVIAFGGAAAEAQWIQTGTGPFVYTDTANWTGGTINGNFSGFTLASSTTTQVVQFTGNYNLGSSMNFGYNSNIVSGTAGDMRFVASGADRTLNFGGLWTVNLTNNGSGSVISFGSTTANQRLNVALTAPTTFNSALSIDNNTGFVFLNDISGTQTITKIGTGAVILEGAATTSGGIAVREGQLNLSVFATLLNVPAVSLGGSTDITRNALLNLDNRQGSRAGGGGQQAINNRLNTSVVLTGLGNGQLSLRGNDTAVISGTIGTFANQAGVNRLYVVLQSGTAGAATDRSTTLTVTSLARSAGTTLGVQGGSQNNPTTTFWNLGQGSGTSFPQLLATQIGGATSSLANVNGIVPWAFVGSGNAPSAFATYGANGFKPYGFDASGTINTNGATEVYAATIAAGSSTSNVRITAGESVSGTTTINSLTVASAVTVSRGASTDTIRLTSGGLMATVGNVTMQPRIDFNGREGIVFSNGVLTVTGGLTNDGGNGVSYMAGTAQGVGQGVLLDAASTYTGPTRINFGVVTNRTVNGIPQTSDVRVDSGGVLDLWDGLAGGTIIGALSGPGRVTARNSGGVSSTLVTGSGNGSGDFGGTINNGSAGSIAFTKVGTGTQTLSGSNTYTGATAVNAGTLAFDRMAALNSSSGIGIAAGSVLDYTGTTAGTLSRNVTVSSSGTGTIRNSGGQALTLSGTLTKDGRVLRLTGGTFNVAGQIVGASANSDLLVDGTSTVTLSAVNSYNGPTFVNQASTLIVGINNAIPSNSVVTLGDATTRGTLDLGSFTNAIGGLVFSGSGGTLKMTASATNATAQLSAPTGTMTLTNGTLDLAGSGTSAGLYRLLSAQSISGSFASITGTSAAYRVLTTSTSIDYQQRAVLGAVSATNPLAIITGGSAAFAFTVQNSALAGGAELAFASGSLSANLAGAASGTAAAGGPSGSIAGLVFTGTTIGANQQGTFTINALDAFGTTAATGTVALTVLDHATSSLASGSTAVVSTVLDLGTWDYANNVWTSGTNTGLFTIANLAASAGSSLTADLSLVSVSGTGNGFSTNLDTYTDIAGGSSRQFAVFVDPTSFLTTGTQSRTFTIAMSDKTGMSGATSTNTLTVTANVIVVPEPGSLGLAAIGVAAAAYALRRRR